MADRTSIPLTEATWNPVTGCDRVSRGCRRCYALSFAKRLAGRYGYPKEHPFAVTVHHDRLDQPARWRKPRCVFTCSMGDLFHADVPDEAIERVFRVMAGERRHTFLVLTKRPERMAAWLNAADPALVLRSLGNVWLGVSAEDQEMADARLPVLVKGWPGRRVACLEPLLGPLDLSPWLSPARSDVDWVITGGETGPGGREADPDHLRQVRDQCVAAGVPLYFKQWGGRRNKHLPNELDGRKWVQRGDYTSGRAP